jgi:hypothetical protein
MEISQVNPAKLVRSSIWPPIHKSFGKIQKSIFPVKLFCRRAGAKFLLDRDIDKDSILGWFPFIYLLGSLGLFEQTPWRKRWYCLASYQLCRNNLFSKSCDCVSLPGSIRDASSVISDFAGFRFEIPQLRSFQPFLMDLQFRPRRIVSVLLTSSQSGIVAQIWRRRGWTQCHPAHDLRHDRYTRPWIGFLTSEWAECPDIPLQPLFTLAIPTAIRSIPRDLRTMPCLPRFLVFRCLFC